MQAHGAEIAYLFNLLAEIGGRRIFSHAKRRPASEPRGDGYEQRGCFSAVLAVPVREREACTAMADGATPRDHPSQGNGSSPAVFYQMPRCTAD